MNFNKQIGAQARIGRERVFRWVRYIQVTSDWFNSPQCAYGTDQSYLWPISDSLWKLEMNEESPVGLKKGTSNMYLLQSGVEGRGFGKLLTANLTYNLQKVTETNYLIISF